MSVFTCKAIAWILILLLPIVCADVHEHIKKRKSKMQRHIPDSPRVGVGVFVFRSREDQRFLLGLRKGSHGAGTWSLPGGHLEKNETFEQCSIREIKEETNLEIENVRFFTAVESFFQVEEKHYVTIFMTAFVKQNDGQVPEPTLAEPEKCEGWVWHSFREMRELDVAADKQLFLPLKSLLTQRPRESATLEHVEQDASTEHGTA